MPSFRSLLMKKADGVGDMHPFRNQIDFRARKRPRREGAFRFPAISSSRSFAGKQWPEAAIRVCKCPTPPALPLAHALQLCRHVVCVGMHAALNLERGPLCMTFTQVWVLFYPIAPSVHKSTQFVTRFAPFLDYPLFLLCIRFI